MSSWLRQRWGTGSGLRAMLVDDNPHDRALVRRALRRDFEELDVTEIGTAASFEDALGGDAVDVVVTDYLLGWSDGIRVLDRVRAEWPQCAVVMFTGTGNEEVAVRAMKNGLDDYVVKAPHHAGRIPVAIRRAMDRRAQRQRARAAEAQIRQLFDRLPAGVYRANQENRVLYANQALADIVGAASPDDLIGTDMTDAFLDDRDERSRRRARKESAVVTSTIRMRRVDGRVIWIRDSGRLVRDVDGTPLYYEGVIQDMTEVHEAQLEVRRQSQFVELLQAVTATANEYATLDDALAPVLRVIRTALGWPLAHVFLVQGDVLVPTNIWADDGSGRFALFRRRTAETTFEVGEGLPGRVLETGGTAWMADLRETPDFVRLDPAATEAFATGVATPVTLHGEVLAVLELFHPEPQPEDPELRRVLDKAGVQIGRVAERERAEQERQEMEAAAREAQRLDAVGRLAGGIAHDFNNLLTVIRSQTDLLLLDLPASSARRDEVEAIQMAADRAAGLTSQLLAFSREQALQPRVVDLNDIVASMIQLLERIIGEDITVVRDLAEELPPIAIDPHQLEQVIINLAVNARHAMPDGGRLKITTGITELDADEWPDLEAGRYVELRVADTGHGMDAETKERIFEPFYTTKSTGEGTGLGLAMAHGVVRQSGGGIHVESEPGQGATFHLWFPPAAGAIETVPEVEAPSRTALREATGRILVVEDDPNVRAMIEKALTRSGFGVRVVPDAEEGLEVLEAAESFDLLLTDLLLPGITGAELARHVRQRHSELPVIVMSGYTEDSIGNNGQELPVDVAFLQKPFTVRGLVDAVQIALAGS